MTVTVTVTVTVSGEKGKSSEIKFIRRDDD
jgi:hypothetical protein